MKKLIAPLLLGGAIRFWIAWTLPVGSGADPNCAPDEAAHFEAVRALAAAGRAPGEPVYRVFPPSQYLVQAATLHAAGAPWPGRSASALSRLRAGLRMGFSDPLGLRHFQDYMSSEWLGAPGRGKPHSRAASSGSSVSSVGDFRNMNLPLPGPLVAAIWAAMAWGAAAAYRRARESGPVALRAVRFFVACAALNLALVLFECWFVDLQPQGRYLLGNVLLA